MKKARRCTITLEGRPCGGDLDLRRINMRQHLNRTKWQPRVIWACSDCRLRMGRQWRYAP